MTLFNLSEEERQMILLAIAHLAVERPGWDGALGELAHKLKGRPMFEDFKQFKREAMGVAQEASGA